MLAEALLALALASDPAAPAATPPATPSAEAEAAPSGDADPSVESTVRGYLGAIDRPVPPEAWRALGPGAEAELARIALAPGEFTTRRARALEGLAAIGGPRAEEVHLALARGPDAPRGVRSSALRGLGRLLPPGRAARELRPSLERDPDRSVRAVAAEVLSRRAPREACPAIRAQALKEGGPRGRWARAVAACAR